MNDAIKYSVTGTDVYGKRFRLVYRSWVQALSINLHNGSVWQECEGFPRKLLKRVKNGTPIYP